MRELAMALGGRGRKGRGDSLRKHLPWQPLGDNMDGRSVFSPEFDRGKQDTQTVPWTQLLDGRRSVDWRRFVLAAFCTVGIGVNHTRVLFGAENKPIITDRYG